MFLRSSHDAGPGGLSVVIRVAAGWGTCVAGVPFFDIKAAGGTVIFIVPVTSCAGRLVSAEPDWVSLVK